MKLTGGATVPLGPNVLYKAASSSISMGPGGETGRRKGLKILFPQGSVGSIPTPGTKQLSSDYSQFWPLCFLCPIEALHRGNAILTVRNRRVTV
jgi:hypothetical protein